MDSSGKWKCWSQVLEVTKCQCPMWTPRQTWREKNKCWPTVNITVTYQICIYGIYKHAVHRQMRWPSVSNVAMQLCRKNKVWARRKHVPHGQETKRDREGVQSKGGTKTVGQLPTSSLEGKLHHSHITQWPQITNIPQTRLNVSNSWCLNKTAVKRNTSTKVSRKHRVFLQATNPLLFFWFRFFLVEVAHATPASW